MARVPGTETPSNRQGWRPGDLVRGRRSRAADAQGLVERPGIVTEVRGGHVRVLFDPRHSALWVTNETVTSAEGAEPPDLSSVRQLLRTLGAVRFERETTAEGEQLVFFCVQVDGDALDAARAALGAALARLEVAPEGVHEIAVRFTLAPDGD